MDDVNILKNWFLETKVNFYLEIIFYLVSANVIQMLYRIREVNGLEDKTMIFAR